MHSFSNTDYKRAAAHCENDGDSDHCADPAGRKNPATTNARTVSFVRLDKVEKSSASSSTLDSNGAGAAATSSLCSVLMPEPLVGPCTTGCHLSRRYHDHPDGLLIDPIRASRRLRALRAGRGGNSLGSAAPRRRGFAYSRFPRRRFPQDCHALRSATFLPRPRC